MYIVMYTYLFTMQTSIVPFLYYHSRLVSYTYYHSRIISGPLEPEPEPEPLEKKIPGAGAAWEKNQAPKPLKKLPVPQP